MRKNIGAIVGAIVSAIITVSMVINSIETDAKHSISTIVNDYCSKQPEFRHFVRAEANRIIFPHKIEITCGDSNE